AAMPRRLPLVGLALALLPSGASAHELGVLLLPPAVLTVSYYPPLVPSSYYAPSVHQAAADLFPPLPIPPAPVSPPFLPVAPFPAPHDSAQCNPQPRHLASPAQKTTTPTEEGQGRTLPAATLPPCGVTVRADPAVGRAVPAAGAADAAGRAGARRVGQGVGVR